MSPNIERRLKAVRLFGEYGLGGMGHHFFDILSPGLMGAADLMFQENSGRKGIRMREVR
jgi:hypothetical protein